MATAERTILVTGGHGFLGSHVVELLLGLGFRVRCLLRQERTVGVFRGQPVEIRRGDLRSDEGLDAAVDGVERVIHVAGLVAAPSPARFMAVNMAGTRRLARAVARTNPDCRRFTYVSSQAAAGPSFDGEPIDESRPPHPLTHYGRSKLEGERLLPRALGRVPFSVVRPPAIYGPRDEALLPFFQMAALGLAPGFDGEGRVFNILHAADVAQGTVDAALKDAAIGRTYFLSDGPGCSYARLAEGMEAAFGHRLRRVPVPDALLDVAAVLTEEMAGIFGRVPIFGRQKAIELKARWWLCSAARVTRELGWSPRIPLDEGLARTAASYREEGKVRVPRGSVSSV